MLPLTSKTGLKAIPLALATLLKHYSGRVFEPTTPVSPDAASHDGEHSAPMLKGDLRKEELGYDQVFTIVQVSSLPPRSLYSFPILAPALGRTSGVPLPTRLSLWFALTHCLFARSYLTIPSLLHPEILGHCYSVSGVLIRPTRPDWMTAED